jgi:hypothetical protein
MPLITYHYCAEKHSPSGYTDYSDGILESGKPLTASDYVDARNYISKASAWEDDNFVITSLTRL